MQHLVIIVKQRMIGALSPMLDSFISDYNKVNPK